VSHALTLTPGEDIRRNFMAISRDQVIWVYRTLLLREPESEDVIAGYINNTADRIDMILQVMQSDEFKISYRDEDG
jgi:hypothetical protein